jgi:hypothetical protein
MNHPGQPIKAIAGIRYGKLTAVEFKGLDSHHRALWLFQCECGGQKTIIGSHVIQGNTRSCGCMKKKRNVYDEAHYRNRIVYF